MTTKSEFRFLATAELRAIDGEKDQPGKLVGYAAVFDSPSEDLGGFTEVIKPGAFRNALAAGADVLALVNHNRDLVLGRTSAGTLKLIEDQRGLRYEITPPDTSYARDLMTSIKRGDIAGSSFGFRVRSGGQKWGEERGKVTRELRDLDLLDVSPVAEPAYAATDVAVRSLQEWQATIRKGPTTDVLRRRLDLEAAR